MTLDEFNKRLKDAGVLGTDTIDFIEIEPFSDEPNGDEEIIITRRAANNTFNVMDRFDP